MKVLRPYLLNAPFTLVTDHSALRSLFRSPQPGRQLRWVLSTQEFSFDVIHRPGKKHGDADGLSRLPINSTKPYGEEEVEELPTISSMLSVLSPHIPLDLTGVDIVKLLQKMQKTDDWVCKQRAAYELARKRKIEGYWEKRRERGDKAILEKESVVLEKYLIENDMLWRKSVHGNQVVVPHSLRSAILKFHHGAPWSAHLGTNKCFKMIARKFYWKGCRRDVRKWIKSCLVCARRKPHRPTQAGKRQSLGASAPFRTVAIDCVGPYTPDADGNCYLLTGIDVFTRWPFAIPIEMRKQKLLLEHYTEV